VEGGCNYVRTVDEGGDRRVTDLERAWAEADDDPDLERDLGYRPFDLEIVVAEQYGQLLFLPQDDDILEEDSFVVADKSLVIDLEDKR
jgi:uncharacterized protein YqcC (DUF446 family)